MARAVAGRGGKGSFPLPPNLEFDRKPGAPQADRKKGAHFGRGAAASPEVPAGGGASSGSRTSGAGFSIAGSTSFGRMTPFDRLSLSLKFWSGAVDSVGAVGAGAGPGAWANAEPATRAIPATNRQRREPMIVMPF
jgi:hypothetical protein